MKIVTVLFPALILIHGSLHLMGFFKGFKLAEMEQLHTGISRTGGVFWLLSALLFLVALLLYFFRNEWWIYLLLAACVLSTVLIITAWKDARFGMIPNVIILAMAVTAWSSLRMERMVREETLAVLSPERTTSLPGDIPNDPASLPPVVRKWLKTSGAEGKPFFRTVQMTETALMKMKTGQKDWYEAHARQSVSIVNPAFVWTVRMNMFPLVTIRGRDKFMDGKGEMLIKLNSLVNIVHERGEKLDEGSMQRYLGEICWYPSAALSRYVSWEALGPLSARATMEYNGTKGQRCLPFQ